MSTSTGQPKIRPWHIANTTVRNPFRLKGGLQALVANGFEGNMGKAEEENIARALHESGVISLSDNTNDITSIARKWRNVLVKLGFIWPNVKLSHDSKDAEGAGIGEPFTLTPNGTRLLASKSLKGEQEVLLRSIAALRLPSPLEPNYKFDSFYPLRHVIGIINELEASGSAPYISRLEMASIVILTNGQDDPSAIANEIKTLRARRATADSKRRFDSQTIQAVATSRRLKTVGTLYDYQDVTFRYLKATGLFQSRGRGITFVPEKQKLAKLLFNEVEAQLDRLQYLIQIASGAILPTDTQDGATEVLSDLLAISKKWKIDFDTSNYDLSTPENVSLARHDLEQLIFDAKEKHYASDQGNQIDEILAYLKMLDENRSTQQFGEEQLAIPKEERPAYFEWLLWRVLLALGDLVVPPSKVRRFKIDQDFLPVSTASGGGADVIAEYADSVLAVEVTLTENSRQEAAEGEPVRRHVADILEQFEPQGKAVYGLFVARRIDTNTAETFRIGVWYKRNDERESLDIVPLTLEQLRNVLHAGLQEDRLEPQLLIDVIVEASSARLETDGAPEWKTRIADIVSR